MVSHFKQQEWERVVVEAERGQNVVLLNMSQDSSGSGMKKELWGPIADRDLCSWLLLSSNAAKDGN